MLIQADNPDAKAQANASLIPIILSMYSPYPLNADTILLICCIWQRDPGPFGVYPTFI